MLKTDIPEPQSVEQPRAESCRTVVPLVVSPSGKTVSGVSCEVCTKLPSNLEGLAARIETLEASDAGHVAKIEGLENENSKLWEKVPTVVVERFFISSNHSDVIRALSLLLMFHLADFRHVQLTAGWPFISRLSGDLFMLFIYDRSRLDSAIPLLFRSSFYRVGR